MSLTSGFFNSLDGDRKYSAEQLSSLFDGIIKDGVLEHYGECFKPTIRTDGKLSIGSGKAWMNSKWLWNDSTLVIDLPSSSASLDRYDMIVIEMDTSTNSRTGSIKVISGEESSTPTKPEIVSSGYVKQYPICYLYRKAGVTNPAASDMENMIGTEGCPYVTAPLQAIDITDHFAQWESQFRGWSEEQKSTFDEWYNGIKGAIDENVATRLTAIVNEHTSSIATHNDLIATNIKDISDLKKNEAKYVQKSGGTFSGRVIAAADDGYNVAHVRNVVCLTEDPGAGASVSYPNGTIIEVYE